MGGGVEDEMRVVREEGAGGEDAIGFEIVILEDVCQRLNAVH